MHLGGLRKLRKRRKLTLRRVEEITGYCVSSLSNYERGIQQPPAPVLYHIAQKLGVPMEVLCTPEKKPRSKPNSRTAAPCSRNVQSCNCSYCCNERLAKKKERGNRG